MPPTHNFAEVGTQVFQAASSTAEVRFETSPRPGDNGSGVNMVTAEATQ